MNSLLILAPLFGVGIGTVAAYGITRNDRRIHFVERNKLNAELDKFDIDLGSAETCVECGDEIGPEDVGAIVRHGDDYRVVCDKPTCLDTYDVE